MNVDFIHNTVFWIAKKTHGSLLISVSFRLYTPKFYFWAFLESFKPSEDELAILSPPLRTLDYFGIQPVEPVEELN
ncbi:MAG: hypothetical protein ACFFCZ_31185 [Promethearchaeota archaeon]